MRSSGEKAKGKYKNELNQIPYESVEVVARQTRWAKFQLQNEDGTEFESLPSSFRISFFQPSRTQKSLKNTYKLI